MAGVSLKDIRLLEENLPLPLGHKVTIFRELWGRIVNSKSTGFEVRGDGEKVEKGKVKEEAAEFAGPGGVTLPSAPTPKEEEEKVTPAKEEWIEVRNTKGELIAWEPLHPGPGDKTGQAIPERRIWVSSGEKPPTEPT